MRDISHTDERRAEPCPASTGRGASWKLRLSPYHRTCSYQLHQTPSSAEERRLCSSTHERFPICFELQAASRCQRRTPRCPASHIRSGRHQKAQSHRLVGAKRSRSRGSRKDSTCQSHKHARDTRARTLVGLECFTDHYPGNAPWSAFQIS